MRFSVVLLLGFALLAQWQVHGQSTRVLKGAAFSSSGSGSIGDTLGGSEASSSESIGGSEDSSSESIDGSEDSDLVASEANSSESGSFDVELNGSGSLLSINASSIDDSSLANSIGFYNTMTKQTQKSYFVGIRITADAENLCYGVLISPRYVLSSGCPETFHKAKWSNPLWIVGKKYMNKRFAVIGSIHNSGSHDDDGSETIEISDYKQYKHYNKNGNRAAMLYKLKQPSKLAPVALTGANAEIPDQGTTMTTLGWVPESSGSNTHVLSERYVMTVSKIVCIGKKTWFQDAICTMALVPNDGCNVVNGSPLIMETDGKDVLYGLRFTYKEACGITGYPIAYTSFAGDLDWIEKTAKLK